MSDEFCAGVQILLKRMESNPDEFKGEYGRWSDIRNGVFAYKEQGERSPWVRGLTKAEIDAMYEKLSAIHRAVLDEYVMKNVLEEPEELKYQAKERYVKGWTDPRIQVTAGGSGGGSGGSGVNGGSGGGVTVDNAALRKMVDEQIQQKKQHRKESALSKLKKELGL